MWRLNGLKIFSQERFAICGFSFSSFCLIFLEISSIHCVTYRLPIKSGLMRPTNKGRNDKNMNETNTQFGITRHLPKLIWVVAFVAILGLIYVLGTKTIKTMAVTGCMQAARLETKTESDETVMIPETYWYEKCLTESGNK